MIQMIQMIHGSQLKIGLVMWMWTSIQTEGAGSEGVMMSEMTGVGSEGVMSHHLSSTIQMIHWSLTQMLWMTGEWMEGVGSEGVMTSLQGLPGIELSAG